MNDKIHDIEDILDGFSRIAHVGRIEGFFALQEFKAQTDRQVKFAEYASQAMAARRRVYNEAVQTVTAQVEAELAIHRIIAKRAQLLHALPGTQPSHGPPPQLPPIGNVQSPLSTSVPPMSTYVSDQTIQDEALVAAITYPNVEDKVKFWSDWEKRMTAKKYPDSVIEEMRAIAKEVIRRTST